MRGVENFLLGHGARVEHFVDLFHAFEARTAGRHRKNIVPLARFGTTEEIANLATFLLSDLCPYQTGDCVTMDGGEWIAGAGEFSDYRKVPREAFKAALAALRKK